MTLNNILSLFDGISCGQEAINRARISYNNYFASEIDKNTIKITLKNYPNTIQLGDVQKIEENPLFPKSFDLLLAGSPCQGFSLSGKQLNFEDERSKLYFKFSNILKEYSPRYFLLENVVMKKEYQKIITDDLGVEPIMIDSRLFSAQSRRRLYWTNIPIQKPISDKNIYLKDILEDWQDIQISDENAKAQIRNILGTSRYKSSFKIKRDTQGRILVMRPDGLKIQRIGRIGEGRHKSEIITVLTQPYIFDGRVIRKVSPIEAERLQTLPDNYTYIDGITDGIRYRSIGNAWTVDVISYILGFIE